VTGLDDHPNPFWLQFGHDQVGKPFGHALLDLRPTRNHVNDSGQFRQPNDTPIRDVANVRLPGKREQVVFAATRKLDVLDQDHLIRRLGEGFPEVDRRIEVEPSENLGVHPRDPVRGFPEPFTIGVFPDGEQYLSHCSTNAIVIDGGCHLGRSLRQRSK
jgi:hypothetical protein